MVTLLFFVLLLCDNAVLCDSFVKIGLCFYFVKMRVVVIFFWFCESDISVNLVMIETESVIQRYESLIIIIITNEKIKVMSDVCIVLRL